MPDGASFLVPDFLPPQSTHKDKTMPKPVRRLCAASAPATMRQLVVDRRVTIYPVGFYRTKAKQILNLCRLGDTKGVCRIASKSC